MSETILITGANGEIGHGLILELAKLKKYNILALDKIELDSVLKPFVSETIVADILDRQILENLFDNHKISIIFHLAALLSTAAEKDPERAHDVNVNGTHQILSVANHIGINQKRTLKFIFPSTIAVYGLPNLKIKNSVGAIKEDQFTTPITMYGINKLYCEMLGKYYSSNYAMLKGNHFSVIDFRCVRFPGIISAITIPSGGTSDYAPEMIHSAAKGEGYESFVRPDTIIPFMVMPDAIKALIMLSEAPKEKLTQYVYNVSGFSASAQEIAELVNKVFPDSAISFAPDTQRQKIVDSWPAAIDDSAAKKDWGWKADYDMQKAFSEYLIPEIQNKYSKQ